ncbi:MAG: hypothetical protein D6781_09525, partial [Verrucomicrobia bacterium]
MQLGLGRPCPLTIETATGHRHDQPEIRTNRRDRCYAGITLPDRLRNRRGDPSIRARPQVFPRDNPTIVEQTDKRRRAVIPYPHGKCITVPGAIFPPNPPQINARSDRPRRRDDDR